MVSPLEHRSVHLVPRQLPPPMALPLPHPAACDLPGLLPVLERYEFAANRQARWEALRLSCDVEFVYPWRDDQ